MLRQHRGVLDRVADLVPEVARTRSVKPSGTHSERVAELDVPERTGARRSIVGCRILRDGVTESIISSLSKLPNVRVISRTSSFHYKGLAIDPETVGQELDVEALVIGRIVQRGDELSISAELVRTRDSGQIWGEQYQRATADIFDIQKEMAREISDALRVQLTSEQEESLTKQFTASSEAYAAYLKGRYHWNRRTKEGIRQAIVYFQKAIEEDSDYALAHTGLADSFSLLGFYYESPRSALPQARAATEQALELDDRLGEAHASLAWIKTVYDWDFAGAEREFLSTLVHKFTNVFSLSRGGPIL